MAYKIYAKGKHLEILDTISLDVNRIHLEDVIIESTPSVIVFIDRLNQRRRFSYKLSEVQKLDGNIWNTTDDIISYIDDSSTTTFDSGFVNDETNQIAIYLKNGGSEQQAVDGSTTPVEFSYTPPAGYNFICTRVIFFMEGTTVFDSTTFGNLTKLTNGWALKINGVETLVAVDNKDLGTYMFDMHGVKIYGKEDKTIIGRFSFDKLTPNGEGLTIRDGLSISTVVKDPLQTLVHLNAKVMGALIKV